MNKFIYVFNEADRDTLLSHGYNLIQQPKPKKPGRPKKKVEGEEADKEETKYWVFENKSAVDYVLYSIKDLVFSNTLTF